MADHLYVVVALGPASRDELHEAAEAVQQVLEPFVSHVIAGDVMVYQLTRYLAERVGDEHSGSRRLDVLERDAPHLIAPIEPTDV